MSALSPPPQTRTIGTALVDGKSVPVQADIAWFRYWAQGLYDRVGGATGPSTVEAAQEAGGNAGTEEARAAVIELRSDLEQFASHGRIAAAEELLSTVLDMDVFALLAMVAELRERVTALTERVNTFDQAPSL